jgi:hypothetical protein
MLFARCLSDGVAFLCPEVANGIRTYHSGEIDVDRDVDPVRGTVHIPDAIVEVIDAVAEAVVEQPPLDKGTVRALQAAIDEAGINERWLKKQLVALGVENVNDAHVLGRLSEEQAKGLLQALSDVVDAQNAHPADG